jgi:molecular chaperone DnaK
MKYIPVAIDHGTSNSSVAFMENGKPAVIKPDGLNNYLPSVVYINKHRRRFVGHQARRSMLLNQPEEGNGYGRYKLGIGQDGRYEFRAAREVLSAQQLGALVISELLSCYRQTTDEDPMACVITVPAKFEQNACDGTRRAAALAGLQYSPLLMEPVAAALAYGFSNADERARWMVFDLGGGTLDVSLVSVRQGKMIVEDHAGDTRLGGERFDRALLDYVLRELGRHYQLKNFIPDNPQYEVAWNKLMLACEDAKIKLSEKETAKISVDGVLCRDERGNEVRVEVPITREQYIRLITADLEKAVNCCQSLLRKNRLETQAVNRLILVGGPTKTPDLQQMLRDRLHIQFDTSIDPMTAVAQGAALYAATQEIPAEYQGQGNGEKMPANATLKLAYSRNVKFPTCQVMGTVTGPAAQSGLSVEIKRRDGLWRSGQLPVDEYGSFSTDVRLIEENRSLSRFTTTVSDDAGRPLAFADEPEIFYQLPEVESVLANSLMVATQGNQTAILVQQGARLPAKGKEDFVTTKPLRRGSGEDVLKIAVLEGVTHLLGEEDRHADCNAHVGSILIAGDDARVSSDLPAGTEVTVRLRQDESREIHATAYIPVLNADFTASFEPEKFDIDLPRLIERHEGLQLKLEKAKKIQQEYPLPEIAEALATVHRVDAVQSLAQELDRAAQGETNSRYRAYKNLLELAGTLNHIEALQTKPRLRQTIRHLRPLVEEQEKAELAQIEQEFAALDANASPAVLASIAERLEQIDVRVRWRPIFQLYHDWQAFPEQFRGTQEQLAAFNDGQKLLDQLADRLSTGDIGKTQIEQAQQAHERLLQLWPELPGWKAAKPLTAGGPAILTDIKKKSGDRG